jgi:hypothetical protein
VFGARRLEATQLFDVAHAHGKLGEMQHGSTTRASSSFPTGSCQQEALS